MAAVMKILQLTNKVPYPPKDGGAIATLNLSTGLADTGHQVSMLAMNTPKHNFEVSRIPSDITKKVHIEAVDVDTNIKPAAAFSNLLFSSLPYNASRFFSESYGARLIEILKHQEFDIIQLEGLYLAHYIPLIRKHSKALIALRAHNIEHEIWQRTAQQEKSFLKKHYFKILAKRIMKFKKMILNTYDLLVPITQRDADRFTLFGNTRPMHVSPVGYQIANRHPEPDKIRFPSVGCLGTLDWFPNQEGLIWFVDQVWPEIKQKRPELPFYIAGRNAPGWLEAYLSKKPVTYLGEIEDAEKFIRETAIMVVPLFSGSGMRVKIIEGMALGKTIVTTSIGAEGIPVQHLENIVVEDTAEGFVKRIIQLIDEPHLFNAIGSNATRFIHKNFDNMKVCKELSDFYTKNLE